MKCEPTGTSKKKPEFSDLKAPRFYFICKGKVKQFRYRPGVAQRVPGS